jgi:hypothetical protein
MYCLLELNMLCDCVTRVPLYGVTQPLTPAVTNALDEIHEPRPFRRVGAPEEVVRHEQRSNGPDLRSARSLLETSS